MKLFYAPGSSFLLPHIVLREAELQFEPIKIDEHTKAISGGGDFRSVNPLGYVPALVLDDGPLLTEGTAIVQYIADLVPEKKLAPPNGTIERVKLQVWLNFCASEMHKGGFSPLFYKGIPEEGRDVFRAAYAEESACRRGEQRAHRHAEVRHEHHNDGCRPDEVEFERAGIRFDCVRRPGQRIQGSLLSLM
jgi:glutathione S-transferase